MRFLLSILIMLLWSMTQASAQKITDTLQFVVSVMNPVSQRYMVEMRINPGAKDTLKLVMPRWTPGYYQMMDYASLLMNFYVKSSSQNKIKVINAPNHVWTLVGVKNQELYVSYDIQTDRKFVATNYLDEKHGYVVGAGTFLCPDGALNSPLKVKMEIPESWSIATGLKTSSDSSNSYYASGFDELYDCPMLMGTLETLESFTVKGINHRFVGIELGDFDKTEFIQKLEKMVVAAVDIIGDVPYDQYSFIAIGPGRGGIEHLNNTTISFDGAELNEPENMNRMLKFLAHEYFHHYNVKRIRPFELGPFDYEQGSRTNLLWVSEGLTVYYEYLILKRAGLIDEKSLLLDFENEINMLQNNPGRHFQSAQQASYDTWHDGPFGETDPEKSISVYNKGAVLGLVLDLAIRHHTHNQKSLDDVMRLAYWHYYKKLERGFTEAEFQKMCEDVAQVSLSDFFEYVYTTKEIDFDKYLGYAGLTLIKTGQGAALKYQLQRIENPSSSQSNIFNSLIGN